MKWTYYYLYVILAIFSRYAVGWMVAEQENATLAEQLIEQTCEKQRITPGQLTIHADRGAPMTAKTVAELMVDLGVQKSHSRPHVSDDNPYSEAQFKTVKNHPTFPDRFGAVQDARAFSRRLFAWYNTAHRHEGLGLLTPEAVHYGRAPEIIDRRRAVLATALRPAPGTLRSAGPRAPDAARGGLDQPAAQDGWAHTGGCTLNSASRCPKIIDKFRPRTGGPTAPSQASFQTPAANPGQLAFGCSTPHLGAPTLG